MNPNQSAQRPNLFESIENWNEFEKPEAENTSVSYTEEHKQNIRESWDSFYRLKTEDITEVTSESPATKIEVTESVTIQTATIENNNLDGDFKPEFIIDKSKGSGSSLEEAGLKLNFSGLGKELGRGLFGALGLFKEIFMDTAAAFVPKKEKKKAKKQETDPAKAAEAAKKEADKQKKKNNIAAFIQALASQAAPAAVSVEAVRVETQEKANINQTIKVQESYKGIKDRFGRLTIYAASMFERAQLDQEKQVKKQEKEMKIASLNKSPDLNLDKAAEGGFLSSTGGQGAG